jgi:ribosomal protein L27
MARKGGLTSKFYRETRGIKVSGGQPVTSGTILTRQGDRWKPGVNVIGRIHLTAACDGEVYFTKKRGLYGHKVTYVHIRPLDNSVGV